MYRGKKFFNTQQVKIHNQNLWVIKKKNPENGTHTGKINPMNKTAQNSRTLKKLLKGILYDQS